MPRNSPTAPSALSDPERALRAFFGFDRFLPGQRDTVEAVLAGRDTLCILPTGAGKSLTYQLPARIFFEAGRGVTVVVSPLISLMKDQADALAARGWAGVGVLNSHIPAEEQARTLAALQAGELCLLYVTPERLESPTFLETMRAVTVALLAVDEAHCVSQWGDDFRTAFLRLDEAVYALRASQEQHFPMLALTATAPPLVRDEILHKLRMDDPAIILSGFERDNLQFSVEHVADESAKVSALAALLGPDAEARRLRGPGIIYSATVRATEPIAAQLREWGWRVATYHGQMEREQRQRTQDDFMAGELEVVVATNAFGLGIDKQDIRFVLHWHLPGSPESYSQEAGRAGRDGLRAECILFFCPADRHLQAFFASQAGPTEEEVRAAWTTLGRLYPGEPMPLARLASEMGVRTGEVERLILPLEEGGYLERLEDGRMRPLRIVPPSELDLPMADALRRQLYDQSRLRMMEGYALTTDCRHEFLLNYLGQPFDTDNCGHCDNCRAGTSIRQSDLDLPFRAGDRVEHPSWGAGAVQRLEGAEAVTVLFPSVGYKTLALEILRENPSLLLSLGELPGERAAPEASPVEP